ncbi:uncharacterized protein LOC103958847 [Pyrus x bretschneideri]|uniref:uncharacterized protein LOC103958847 n=1 Tax=Pyrus x bretschneideri TaxID=225117 RepID=UPI00202E2CBA|nr:uncharacterized protein LOC103958847 [Pyrus x bretschneideri]
MFSLQLKSNHLLLYVKLFYLLSHRRTSQMRTTPFIPLPPTTQLLPLSLPDEVAELMVKRTLPEAVGGVRVFLKMLSLRLGTFLLCGKCCFDWKWPFIHKFSEMSFVQKRTSPQGMVEAKACHHNQIGVHGGQDALLLHLLLQGSAALHLIIYNCSKNLLIPDI